MIPETKPMPKPCFIVGLHNNIAKQYITIFQFKDMPPIFGETIRKITPMANNKVVIVIQRNSINKSSNQISNK